MTGRPVDGGVAVKGRRAERQESREKGRRAERQESREKGRRAERRRSERRGSIMARDGIMARVDLETVYSR
jgi:hypothetical protein